MVQQPGGIAPGVLERVGQHRQAVEVPAVADARGERDGRFGTPTRVERDRAERVAEDAAEEGGLAVGFGVHRAITGGEPQHLTAVAGGFRNPEAFGFDGRCDGGRGGEANVVPPLFAGVRPNFVFNMTG